MQIIDNMPIIKFILLPLVISLVAYLSKAPRPLDTPPCSVDLQCGWSSYHHAPRTRTHTHNNAQRTKNSQFTIHKKRWSLVRSRRSAEKTTQRQEKKTGAAEGGVA